MTDPITRLREYWTRAGPAFDDGYATEGLWQKLRHGPLLLRERAVLDMVRQLDAPTVCDAGCGAGRQLVAALQAGAQRGVGVDLSESMLALARENAQRAGVGDRARFVCASATDFACEEQFDLVWALGVFDYYADPQPLLRSMAALSRGQVVATFRRVWAVRSPVRKLTYWVQGCPITLFTKGQVRDHLLRAGLVDVRVERLSAGLYIARGRAPSTAPAGTPRP